MRLQTTFIATIGLTLTISFVVVAVTFYRAAVLRAGDQALREARMLLAAATAARSYSSEKITPLLNKGGSFDRESVPSFSAQSIMKRFSTGYSEYTYRETALDPTNLQDLPSSWELDVIQAFRKDAQLKEFSGERSEAGRKLLYLAQPIQADASCLTCHSEPKNAPAQMVALYGTGHGFNWKEGEIIGARFISVPASLWLESTLSNVFWFLLALAAVLILGLMAAMVMVQIVVIKPVQQLAEQAQRISTSGLSTEEIAESGPQEFRTLARAINRLHRSLKLLMHDHRAEGTATE